MKMKHKQTGEIMEVVGYVLHTSKKGLMYRCLCDARLHPERAGRTFSENTVEVEVPFNSLKPLVSPDWNEVEGLYPPGEFERIRKAKEREFEVIVKNSANQIFSQELTRCMGNGMTEEDAVAAATKKRDEFLRSKMPNSELI